MIVADARWQGRHGIGRYATEVLSRLDVEWSPIGSERSPASPLSALDRPVTVNGARGDLFYSPGYGGLLDRSVPQIVTVHDLIHLQTPWPGRAKYLAYYNGFLRPLIRRNRVVITVSETSRRAIAEWIDDDRVDIVNAGNGCSSAFTAEGPVHVEDFPYFLYVGNLKPHKNVPTILRALALVPDAHVIAVVNDTEGLHGLASVIGVDNRVHLLSKIDDEALASYYRGATATLMPSLLEGFGLPALESISSGTPVIYWQGCRSVMEIVGENGIPVEEATDPGSWAKALLKKNNILKNGISHHQSWDTVAREVTNLLLKISSRT